MTQSVSDTRADAQAGAPAWPSVLTTREQEVASLLARGYTCREIGEILAISIKTVDTHRGRVLRKLGLRNAVALTRHAIRAGLVSGAAEADAERSKKRGATC